MDASPPTDKLHKNLDGRLLGMITLGGSIGTGIFLASGSVLFRAGPGGTLIAYLLMGIMIYFLMTSLGEMAAFMPSSGSFYQYAAQFVDPSLGYALGWNYWYSWAITIAAEIAASSLLMQFWFPNTPAWLWSGAFLLFIVAFNAISTKVFGEIEYWLSLIKISVIGLFIIIGFAMICGFTSHHSVGFSNWRIGDAPFHDGWFGIFSAVILAGFSFQGTELIGIAAGESKNPQKNVPKVIKLVFWRIFLFFILSLLVISFLVPYTSAQNIDQDVMMSPFTQAFAVFDHKRAAFMMNAVILIAILSTANSGMYVASRMLWFLAKEKHIPSLFSRVTRKGIPIHALIATASISLLAFLSFLFGHDSIYLWLVNAGGLSGFIAWMGIAISHYRFRKAYIHQGKDLTQLPYLAKGYPYVPLGIFFLCILIIASHNVIAFMHHDINWQELIISYIGLPLFLLVWFSNKWINKTKIIHLSQCNF
ncbi:amino acid permease [Legionella maioricensis]|uniref:Amino acid permease n=1 Tax=Legionella maioricensis TaxID=2896528 RepID=A0A9X2D0P9_9GAMM|nr:amino acid permease [Legionella maioricensis]MCL9684339.1 amino acid permease [Legionella maioricensis]MCL9688767.1 amino acid permease [Legionella maioricensis]